MSYNFYMPMLSFIGEDSLKDSIIEVKKRKFKKALVVTDEMLVKAKLTDMLINELELNEIEFHIYDKTKPNPTITNVNDGIKIFRKENCDFVISFGGGSPHDCAKGIALILANGGEIKDYEGLDKSEKPQIPLVAINTTAGTASEITRFSIITDEERHIKMAIVDKHVTPIIAVNDPKLMAGMPKSLTAATGMDALTHAIEAYVSTVANPITDACAEKAISLIRDNLKNAVENGSDITARSNMAFAEYLAGMAFNNASLGYVHAMAHQLGGFYNLPHGVCNALLLPHVQEYNIKAAAPRLKKVAELMGADVNGMSDEKGAKKAVELIRKLSQEVGIPESLEKLEVKKEDFSILAENALKDVCGFTNPIQATKEEIIGIFQKAY
ncbi:L-threonine dehydrogenase [Sebaldella sp. S0638]|uniref:L-threonine dehydrogenase n=1 Tax=Sebaldella sp. S0638 TaxID=2957809 RepID=UPI00209D1434|nr:L-threonine dehydrogenase [Sebaldella sp. S0638]MCP1224210.1 L-threonine dehydrogenase [Sebaldella sp. S0638]